GGPRGTLERLRPEPADLLPRNGAPITGFRLSLFKGMGSSRGNAETGFIRSVDDAVHRFYATVVAHMDRPAARRASSAQRAAAGPPGAGAGACAPGPASRRAPGAPGPSSLPVPASAPFSAVARQPPTYQLKPPLLAATARSTSQRTTATMPRMMPAFAIPAPFFTAA